jgi:hypothetical protein
MRRPREGARVRRGSAGARAGRGRGQAGGRRGAAWRGAPAGQPASDDAAPGAPEPPAPREDPGFVLAQLAAGRSFTFEATRRGEGRKRAEGVALADAKDAGWRADAALRVELTDDALALRLRQLQGDARTAREESGVASLFLAIGAVVWRDPRTPQTPRVAPLAFVPVLLERQGVTARYRLRAGFGEAQDNLPCARSCAWSSASPCPNSTPRRPPPGPPPSRHSCRRTGGWRRMPWRSACLPMRSS